MQIFIDADGCPVTKIAAQIAAEHNIPCTVICDTDVPFKRRIRFTSGRQAVHRRKHLGLTGISGCRQKDTQSGRQTERQS